MITPISRYLGTAIGSSYPTQGLNETGRVAAGLELQEPMFLTGYRLRPGY